MQAVLSRKRYSLHGLRGILPAGALAGVPLVDGGIELHARVAAEVRALGDLAQERAGVLLLAGFAVDHPLRPPLAALDGGVHEFIAHAHREVFVLIHDRAVGVAVVTAVVTLLDERPGLFLLLGLGLDEFLDVGMPVLERIHLRRAARLAAGLYDIGHLVVDLEEGERAARASAAAELLARGAEGGEIAARAAAVLEEHGLGHGEAHDVLHVVVDRLNEAGAALRVFVLGPGALGFAGARIVEVVALPSAGAHAVLVPEADVEPHGRVEGAVLIHAQPREFVVESFGALLVGEIAVLDAAIGDRACHAMDELFDGLRSRPPFRVGAVGDVAVEIFRDGDLRGQGAPGLGYLDVFLFEDRLARIVGDLRSAKLPLDFVKRRNGFLTEDASELQSLLRAPTVVGDIHAAGGGATVRFQLNHTIREFCEWMVNKSPGAANIL